MVANQCGVDLDSSFKAKKQDPAVKKIPNTDPTVKKKPEPDPTLLTLLQRKNECHGLEILEPMSPSFYLVQEIRAHKYIEL